MKLNNFTIILTDACNRECLYCPQKKGKKKIDTPIVYKALDFFFPFLDDQATLCYYGGEPLLEFGIIKKSVEYTISLSKAAENKEKQKRIDFSITTNGSLFTPEILEFFNHNHFTVLLSFDGFGHQVTRKKNEFEAIVSTILNILKSYPDIKLKVNSVFTPATVSSLAQSVQFISKLGARNKFTLSRIEDWTECKLAEYEEQMNIVASYVLSEYRKNIPILVDNFNPRTSHQAEGLFMCTACKERISISPDGRLWGCYLFYDYFKGKEKTTEYSKYSIGNLEEFIQNHNAKWSEKISNYSKLRIDNYWTKNTYCFLCEHVYQCNICPVAAGYSNGGKEDLGYIPTRICMINKINSRIKKDFLRRI